MIYVNNTYINRSLTYWK